MTKPETPDPGIPVYATIREAENFDCEAENQIECRFADGQKYAAVVVSLECGELAALIVRAIEQHNAPAVEPAAPRADQWTAEQMQRLAQANVARGFCQLSRIPACSEYPNCQCGRSALNRRGNA